MQRPVEDCGSDYKHSFQPVCQRSIVKGVAPFDAVLNAAPPLSSQPNLDTLMPCPRSRELHVVNAHFTLEGIEAFVMARLFGREKVCGGGLRSDTGKYFEKALG
jgi:hypothetical protein